MSNDAIIVHSFFLLIYRSGHDIIRYPLPWLVAVKSLCTLACRLVHRGFLYALTEKRLLLTCLVNAL